MAKKDPGLTVNMNDLYAIKIKSIYSYVISEHLPFILICAYLFFEYVRPQSIYAGLDILPWSFLILLMTVISVPVASLPRYKSSHPLNKLMVVYLVVVILSSTFSYLPSVSWGSFRMFFDWFLIYFLIIYIVDNESRFLIFLLSFLLYSFKMSQFGAASWAARGFAFATWGVAGAPGWFGNSGELGIQMAIFTPLSVSFVIGLKSHWSKLKLCFFLLFPLTGLMTAIASSSRGALVGIAAAFLWPLLHSKNFIKVASGVVVVSVLVWNFVPEESKARFQNSGDDGTSLHRMERWRHAFDAMTKHPLLGVGHNAWEVYYPDHYTPTIPGPTLVHNAFVQCGAELGFTGLGVCLLMILYCFKANRDTRRLAGISHNKFIESISRGLDSALLGYIASASFVTVQYYPYFWIHLAFVVALNNLAKRQVLPLQKNNRHLKDF